MKREARQFDDGAGGSAFGWLLAGAILGIAVLIWLAAKLVQPLL